MKLPEEIEKILHSLQEAGFEAFVVGGCVRDILLKKQPKDWDIATSATPEEIQNVFPKSFYTNKFGTVTVLVPILKEIEITTYRTEAGYSDQRHPDEVSFTKRLEEDLARRDFTINSLALLPLAKGEQEGVKNSVVIDGFTIIDPFGGLKDLNAGLIRAVGNPTERFKEDALRMMRAVRFVAQLNFEIEADTQEAIKQLAGDIQAVSHERIRDELVKIIMSDNPEKAVNILEQTGLLKEILPEVQEGVGVGQNKHHVFTVFEHCVKSLQFAADYDYSFQIRLSALLHDIGKPRTKRPQGNDYTFYGHEIVGARMCEKLLKRLRFSAEDIHKISHLVRHHMFYYDIGKVTEAGMRRMLRRVGPENFDDLIKLRIAERKGSGVPKARPYRLRHLQFLAEKVSQQPLSVGQLAIKGTDLIDQLKIKPGPIIGGVLNALLAEVIEEPVKNTREYLLHRAGQLQKEDPEKLKNLGSEAMDKENKKREDEIKDKYHV